MTATVHMIYAATVEDMVNEVRKWGETMQAENDRLKAEVEALREQLADRDRNVEYLSARLGKVAHAD